MIDVQNIEQLWSIVNGMGLMKLTRDAISVRGRTVKVDAVRILSNRIFLNS